MQPSDRGTRKTGPVNTSAQMAAQAGERAKTYRQEQEDKRAAQKSSSQNYGAANAGVYRGAVGNESAEAAGKNQSTSPGNRYWTPEKTSTTDYKEQRAEQTAQRRQENKSRYWTPETDRGNTSAMMAAQAGQRTKDYLDQASQTRAMADARSTGDRWATTGSYTDQTKQAAESAAKQAKNNAAKNYWPSTSSTSPAEEQREEQFAQKKQNRSGQNTPEEKNRPAPSSTNDSAEEQRREQAELQKKQRQERQEEQERQRAAAALDQEEGDRAAAIVRGMVNGEAWAIQAGRGIKELEDAAAEWSRRLSNGERVIPKYVNGEIAFVDDVATGLDFVYTFDEDGNPIKADDDRSVEANANALVENGNYYADLLKEPGKLTAADAIKAQYDLGKFLRAIEDGLIDDYKLGDAEGTEAGSASEWLKELYDAYDKVRDGINLNNFVGGIMEYLGSGQTSSADTERFLNEVNRYRDSATTEKELEYWDALAEDLDKQLGKDREWEKWEKNPVKKAWDVVKGYSEPAGSTNADEMKSLQTELAQLQYLRDTAMPWDDVDSLDRQIAGVQKKIDGLVPEVQADKEAEAERKEEQRLLQNQFDAAVRKWYATGDPDDQAEADRIEAEMRKKGLWEEDRFGYGMSSW